MVVPDAENRAVGVAVANPAAASSGQTSALRAVGLPASRIVTVKPTASAICDASVRCQINRYSDSSWLFSSPCT